MPYISSLELVPEYETSIDVNLFNSSIWKSNGLLKLLVSSLQKNRANKI